MGKKIKITLEIKSLRATIIMWWDYKIMFCINEGFKTKWLLKLEESRFCFKVK